MLAYGWPVVAIIIGILFWLHEQHGTGDAVSKAVWQHRILGITIVIAGLLRLGEVITAASLLAILWPLALSTASAQWLLYREPEGAYEDGAHDSGQG